MAEPSITNAVWSSDRDRAFAVLGAPSGRREALSAVLAFNADLGAVQWQVSEPLIGRMRFQWWRDNLDAVARGEPPQHMTAEPLARACRAHAIPAAALARLLDAREAAYLAEQPATLDELEGRVAAVDGAVFRLMAHVLSDGRADADRVADALGAAWGLIGTVRAVPLSASARRCALPRDTCAAAGLDVEALFAEGPQPALPGAVRPVVLRAEQRLFEARAAQGQVPRAVRPALLAAVVAEGHARRLRKAGFDPFDARVQSRTLGPGTSLRLWWAGARGAY